MPKSYTILIDNDPQASASTTVAKLAQLLHGLGWQVQSGPTPSQSGHYLTLSDTVIIGSFEAVNILVCHNSDTIDEYADRLASKAVVVLDNRVDLKISIQQYATISIAFNQVARQAAKMPDITSLTVGLVCGLLGLDLKDLIGPNQDLTNLPDRLVMQAGWKVALTQAKPLKLAKLNTKSSGHLLTGQQAANLGLIMSGNKYVTMPSKLSWPVELLEATQPAIVLTDTASNSSALSRATGAAVAGARSVAILSTKQLPSLAHQVAYATQAEIPLVIIADQTNPDGQNYLQNVLNLIGPGQPIIVTVAADSQECQILVAEASNIAEQYQTPVIVVIEYEVGLTQQVVRDSIKYNLAIERGKLLSSKQATASVNYQRYTDTTDNISPRKVPGQGGGLVVTYADQSIKQSQKCLFKINPLLEHVLPYKLHGKNQADITLVCYGHVTSYAKQAMTVLQQQGTVANVLQLNYVWPLPADRINQLLRVSQHLLVIEDSVSSQLGALIHQQAKIQIRHQLLRSRQHPIITKEVIVETVRRQFTHG